MSVRDNVSVKKKSILHCQSNGWFLRDFEHWQNRLNSIFFQNSLMHIIGIKFCAFYFSHIRAEEVQNVHTTVANFNAKHSAVVNKI